MSLIKSDDWEVFTSGRVNAFGNYFRGDGYPQATPDNPTAGTFGHEVVGGGVNPSQATERPIDDGNPETPIPQGNLEGMRVRSGFLSNVLGIGVRKRISDTTTVTGFIESWSPIETFSRRKFYPVQPDIRQGWVKIEGSWGSVVGGRSLSLFSRGATLTNFFYGHGYALGFAPDVENQGPTNGHIGTGVLGSSFNAGLVYATPSMGGFQLSIGAYDPSPFAGAWERNKWLRPEAEATYEVNFGSAGKFMMFVNGGYHWLYKHDQPDSTGTNVYGVGGGSRLELGGGPVRFRIGGSGYWGRGVGLYYAFENSDGNFNTQNVCASWPSTPACMNASLDQTPFAPRITFGYNVIGQLSLWRTDISAGFGRSVLQLLDIDKISVDKSGDGVPDVVPYSYIRYQQGISGVLVHHVTPSVHLAADFFLFSASWYQGESQTVFYVSVGPTFTW